MALETVPLFMPGTGGPLEIGLILLIAILLFGANKIPKLARSTGEAIGEFQKGREEVEQELEEIRDGATKSPTTGTETGTSTRETESSTETAQTPSDQETQTETDTDAETQE
ncbi:MAG TPA: twin-arginine translocase TatA/TatE family subunit [Natrialbaceae archaeon]|nr:twin-arginine translocase TatA/TatE family subunit [Natrialbaceae archaeon]